MTLNQLLERWPAPHPPGGLHQNGMACKVLSCCQTLSPSVDRLLSSGESSIKKKKKLCTMPINPLNAKPVIIIALRTKRKKHWLLCSKSSLGVLKMQGNVFPSHTQKKH